MAPSPALASLMCSWSVVGEGEAQTVVVVVVDGDVEASRGQTVVKGGADVDGQDPGALRREIEALIEVDAPRETHLALERPVAIHIEYITAYVDDEGDAHFLNDICGYDKEAIAWAEKRLRASR